MLRVTANRRSAERQICALPPSDWNPRTGRVRNSNPNATKLNKLIRKRVQDVDGYLLELEAQEQPIEAAAVLSVVFAGQTYTFTGHFRTYIKARRDQGKISTARLYQQYLDRLLNYTKQREVTFTEFTDTFLNGLIKFWRDNQISGNTVRHRVLVFESVFRDAVKRNLAKGNPFAFIDLKETKVRKKKLTVEELAKLAELPVTPGSGRFHARSYFMIQFYLRGLRVSEVLTLKRENVRLENGEPIYIELTSQKTGELMAIRLHATAQKWVKPYLSSKTPFLLPFLRWVPNPKSTPDENTLDLLKRLANGRSLITYHLAKLETLLGFTKKLRSHMARHTFADQADKKITDKRKISEMLGHRDFKTTQIYLSDLRDDELDVAADAVFD